MAEKTCSRCARSLPVENFNLKVVATGQRQHQCRECQKAYFQIHYQANKAKYVARAKARTGQVKHERRAIVAEMRTRPCTDCGGTFPHYVMEFDHKSGEVKIDAIANLKNTDCSYRKFKEELAKCDIVCANCHRARTYKRRFEAAAI